MKTNLFILLIASTICISIFSCSKEPTPTPSSNTSSYSTSLGGFGRHAGTPTGTPYFLPSTIKLVSQLKGGYPNWGVDTILVYDTISIPYGLGRDVSILFKLYNTNATSYTLTFPAGMILSRDNTTYGDSSQSGMTIAPTSIILPPHDTSNIRLNMFCINKSYHTSYSTDIYSIKVISNNDQINRLINVLQNKTTVEMHQKEIQDIIWEISDGSGLSQADLDEISTWK